MIIKRTAITAFIAGLLLQSNTSMAICEDNCRAELNFAGVGSINASSELDDSTQYFFNPSFINYGMQAPFFERPDDVSAVFEFEGLIGSNKRDEDFDSYIARYRLMKNSGGLYDPFKPYKFSGGIGVQGAYLENRGESLQPQAMIQYGEAKNKSDWFVTIIGTFDEVRDFGDGDELVIDISWRTGSNLQGAAHNKHEFIASAYSRHFKPDQNQLENEHLLGLQASYTHRIYGDPNDWAFLLRATLGYENVDNFKGSQNDIHDSYLLLSAGFEWDPSSTDGRYSGRGGRVYRRR